MSVINSPDKRRKKNHLSYVAHKSRPKRLNLISKRPKLSRPPEEKQKVFLFSNMANTLFDYKSPVHQTWKKVHPYNQRLCKILWDLG